MANAKRSKDWPLHVAAVNVIDLDRMRTLAAHTPLEKDCDIAIGILTETAYHEPSALPSSTCPPSHIPQRDVLIALESGIFELTTPSAAAHGLNIVPQENKQRRRLTIDLLPANVRDTDAPPVHFTPLEQLASALGECSWAASTDFKAWYHQLPLSPSVRAYHTFRAGDATLRLTRAAMGHKANSLRGPDVYAHSSRKHGPCQVQSKHKTYFATLSSTNVLFASQSQEKVDAAISRFKQRCSWVGATIGSTCETARKIEHRGLIYDLANNTRALKPSWLEKLIDRVNLTLRRPTAARLWSLGGMLNWARPLCSAIDELTVVWKLVARSAAKNVNNSGYYSSGMCTGNCRVF